MKPVAGASSRGIRKCRYPGDAGTPSVFFAAVDALLQAAGDGEL